MTTDAPVELDDYRTHAPGECPPWLDRQMRADIAAGLARYRATLEPKETT